jgi:D-alanyl-D-alanine carboxypeptidase/D-alanyl-D-alanine-endopeptidase (penicillin-binding protein 4)
VAVLSGSTGEVLYARGAGRPLIPASNVKVFTIGAALGLLGADFTFATEALADGPIQKGTLKGALVLRGSGDPSLTSEDLWGIVLDLEALGLRAIEGDLILDDSAFDEAQAPAAGDARYGGRPYGALTSALASNFNTLAVEISPGARAGAPARVATVPPIPGVRLENRTRTTSAKGSQSAIGVRFSETEGGAAAVVTVSGSVLKGASPRRAWRAVDRPALLTGLLFKELMRRADISLGGKVRRGRATPGCRTLARRESRPLAVLLRQVGKRSNNLYAEQILKALSGETPGSTRAGLRAVTGWLADVGVETAGLALSDGSGLSRGNRVKAMQIARALRAAARDPRTGAEFRSAFAIAGTDGTLERRLGSLKGRARGKTGYLTGVSALSGWVTTRSEGDSFFAILANGIGPDPGAAKALQNRIVGIIAGET